MKQKNIIIFTLIIFLICLISLYNYLLFHTLAEMFSIFIAGGIFVIAWNTKEFSPNKFLLFIGIALTHVSFIDFIHTIGYKGIGIFINSGVNLSTQLGLAARYLQSISFFAAPFLIGKKIKTTTLFISYSIVTLILCLCVFLEIFPVTFIEGYGLTPFKIFSEYIICFILIMTGFNLRKRKGMFTADIYRLLLWTITMTVLSEIMFTLYINVYGFYNTLGHLFKIISFYLIYLALIQTNLKEPYEKLNNINEIITLCTQSLNLKKILNNVLDKVINILGLEGGAICLLESDEKLTMIASRGISKKKTKDITSHKIRGNNCICGRSIRDLRPLILSNREEVLKFSKLESLRKEKINFHASFPLIFSGKCLGILCVFTSSNQKPDQDRVKIIETVSAQIALTIHNARLYNESISNSAILEEKILNRTKDLETANIKLQELDRLKSIFIASMSHELRTPLNSIIGFSDIILKEWIGTLNNEQKENLRIVIRSGKHLLLLINDIIDVSKIEAGRVEPVLEDFDIYDLINDAVKNYEQDAKNKGLELMVESSHQNMHTDRRKLFQSVLNLLSNAVKFTQKGFVRIIVRKKSDTAETIEIGIEDSGIGIKTGDMNKIFQPFSRIDPPNTVNPLGTGLGLYLTKKIVGEILKGQITFTSKYQEGSKFEITLPVKI